MGPTLEAGKRRRAASDPGTPTAGRPAPAATPRKRKKDLFPYLLVAPASIMELLIHIIPMALGVWVAFIALTQLS
ncbi:sugar ABC transporter permease, partial [Arthrobacter rhombi]